MKKLIATFILTTSLFAIFSCCDDYIRFYEITGFNTKILDTENNELEGSITADSLRFNVRVNKQLVAVEQHWNLINKSYALQPCPTDGQDGLKDDIVEYKFFSSVNYLDIEAGNDLRYELLDSLNVIDFIHDFNDWNPSAFDLYLNDKQLGFLDINLYFKYESEREDTFLITSFNWL